MLEKKLVLFRRYERFLQVFEIKIEDEI